MSVQQRPMLPGDRNDEQDRHVAIRPNTEDRLYDLQLMRDAQIVNKQLLRELGPLPHGGLPVQIKRKPNLPRRAPATPTAMAVDEIPTDPEGAQMFILGKLFKKQVPREEWPIRFDGITFGARCYHTLSCLVIYRNKDQVPRNHALNPSGAPYSPDWKNSWEASHMVLPEEVFSTPVQVRWTSMDGVEHRAEIDLEDIFPERLVLHNVPREQLKDGWGMEHAARTPEILLEINDRTISLYMKAWIVVKSIEGHENKEYKSRRDLILAWAKTF